MGIFSFKPARNQAQKIDESVIVVDLDAMVQEPIYFRFQGKAHVIKPIDTQTFLKLMNQVAKLEVLRKRESFNKEELYDAYAKIFSSVCDTIGRKEVFEMQMSQIGGLYQQICDCITGKAYREQKEKKTPKPAESTTPPDQGSPQSA